MATVSTVALIASAWGCGAAAAEVGREATIWAEIGWQSDNVHFSDSKVDLPAGSMVPQAGLTAPLMQSLNPSHNKGIEGAVLYMPDGSDWGFSASIRFGRSERNGKISQALAPIPTTSFATNKITYPFYPSSNRISVKRPPATREKLDADTGSSESHIILDFQAGKDVGVGLFGHGGTSTLGVGVRFAQFTASRQVSDFQETRDIHFQSSHFMTTRWPAYITNARETWISLSVNGSSSQRFDGAGPSVRWETSNPLWNDPRGGGLSLDWGANAALLFGKQVKKIRHETVSSYQCYGRGCLSVPADADNAAVRTSRTVVVPNVGGFAGISLRYPNIQAKFGYRADWFLNAADVGITARRSSNLLFHGPYASVSLGLGD